MEKFSQIFKKPVDLIIIAGIILALIVGFFTFSSIILFAVENIIAAASGFT